MKGLQLVNPAIAEILIDPPQAEFDVEHRQVSGCEQWDAIHRSIFAAMAEDGHAPILEMVNDKPRGQLHTCWLLGDYKRNRRAGRYSTASPGKHLDKPNAYFYPLPNGGLAIYRFNDAAETDDWRKTVKGRTCIHYNVPLPEVVKPRLLTCKQLDTERFNIRYHIPGALTALQNHVIGGRQKTLKTTIAIDAAVSLASGSPFLGRLPISEACNVVILSGESGLSVLQETARRVCRSKGVCLPDIERLFWSDWLPRFDSPKHLELLEQIVRETACEVLFIDPCYLAMPGTDAANLFVQGAMLRHVSEICQEQQVTPVLLHHLRKRGKGDRSFDPPELDDLSWAGFSEYARQWWLIGRRESYEPGSGSHKLWLSIGGSAGHSALWAVDVEEGVAGEPRRWEVSLSSPSDAREAKKSGTARQRFVDAAREFPLGETKTTIFETAGVKSTPATRNVWDALVNEKVFLPCKVAKGGATYDGFRLAPQTTTA